MSLFAFERRRLDRIEGDLRAEDGRLARMFDVFTRLGKDEGKPPAELQYLRDGPWREVALGRDRARRRISITVTVLLTLLVGVIVLSLS